MNIRYLILCIIFAIAIAGCDLAVPPRCVDGKLYYKSSTKDVWYATGTLCKVIKTGD